MFLVQYLLSSSIDKTVRLWKVGCENCLEVFSHSNYGAYLAFCVFVTRLVLINGCQATLDGSLGHDYGFTWYFI